MPQTRPPKFDQLQRWLDEHKLSGRELAARMGVDKMTVSRLLNGRLRYIDPAIAVAIERETAGAVTASDFIIFMSNKEAA